MTLPEFIGCTLVAFGPAIAMFFTTITDDPIKIILLIFSAFIWLLALLISSFIWFILIPLREYLIFGVIVSIFIQVKKSFNKINYLHNYFHYIVGRSKIWDL